MYLQALHFLTKPLVAVSVPVYDSPLAWGLRQRMLRVTHELHVFNFLSTGLLEFVVIGEAGL
jgi:hypothetical protein